MTFTIPNPKIPIPIIIPVIGPGNTITVKKSVFLTPAMIPVKPAAINNPIITHEFCFHETTTAAVARVIALTARPRCKSCLKDQHVTDNDCHKYTAWGSSWINLRSFSRVAPICFLTLLAVSNRQCSKC
jgi:hypothetical protein